MDTRTGIYRIRHLESDKYYIGSTSRSLMKRRNEHFYHLNKNSHSNRHLQNAWNKYGAESFVFEVLLYCDPENCLIYEQLALDHLQPEYNICLIAGNSLGRKLSQETKRKLSEAHRGKHLSEETRRKMSKSKRGKRLSDETKQRISNSKRNKPCIEETKRKISASLSGRKNGAMDEERKLKISKAQRGENNHQCKLMEQDIIKIRQLYKDGSWTQQALANKYHISVSHISQIINYKTRKYE